MQAHFLHRLRVCADVQDCCTLVQADILLAAEKLFAQRGYHAVTIRTARLGGAQRAFLQDGDAVTLRGWRQKDVFARIGFGDNRGEILAAAGA